MQKSAEVSPLGRVADLEFVRKALDFLREFEAKVNAAREQRGEKRTAIVATAELAPGVIGLFWLHLREYALLFDKQRWGVDFVVEAMGQSSKVDQLGYVCMREEDICPNFDRYLQEYAKQHIQPLPGSGVDWHPTAIPIMEIPVARLMRMEIPKDIRALVLFVGTRGENGARIVSIQPDGWKSFEPRDEAQEHYWAMYGQQEAKVYLFGVSLSPDDVALFTEEIQELDKVEEQVFVDQLVAELGCHWFEEVVRVERPDIGGAAVLLERQRNH